VRLAFGVTLVVMVALPCGAQGRFTLGLEKTPFASGEAGAAAVVVSSSAPEGLAIELETSPGGADLVYRSALEPISDREFRRALWTSPLGRLYYQRAAEEAMLGREGLVGGGRMVGLGLATTALGDGSPSGLQLVMREKWSELTFSDKVRAGVEASFLAALVYYMAETMD
jgi:hypothetical protein